MPYFPVDLGNLDDVDTVSTPPSDGQALLFDEDTQVWLPSDVGSSDGVDDHVYSNTPPADPAIGTIWISKTGQGINPDGTFL